MRLLNSVRNAALFALFVGAATAVQSASAQGQQQFGQPPNTHLSWTNTPNTSSVDVTYFIGAGFSAAQQTAIRNAAAVWTNANRGVTLVEVASAAASGIDVVSADLGFDLGGAALTTVPAGTAPTGNPLRQITSATLTVDSAPFLLPFGTDPVGAGQWDFTAVMIDLFGLGLGLGLAGLGDPASVMRGLTPVSVFPAGPQNRALSAQDINALATLYGAPEPATWTLFGVGLLAMGAWRRRRASKPI